MLNKFNSAIARIKLKALWNSKGNLILKGLKFAEDGKSFSLGEVSLNTNLPMAVLNMDSIENISFQYEDYVFELVIKNLRVNGGPGRLLEVEELELGCLLEVKEFFLEVKNLLESLEEDEDTDDLV